MNAVTEYYERYNEAERLTGTNTGRLEFMTTTHLLDRHFDRGASILELGAGAGIYSLYYGARIERTFAEGKTVKLAHAAADGVGRLMEEVIDGLSAEQFDIWSEYNLKTCEEPSLLGISNHALYVGRKI
ncbi:hypothetical protein F4V43_10960 [Paenibacillus spiritus]|uniref:Class I SAM-dependent methyltransferase n=1 Tax=Paenibacillus spiritus TaxID=2496557 RepID=A0A5J5G8F1_9BACL|nr:hypothetical protein [Paenibacillus spiritus]KAA9003931.1 hypothetical protein F4V43_10960 [Paenibacillus spiritus]